MTNGFQIRGDNINPYHLSIGTVCTKGDLIALVKKADGTYTLPRETMYSNESLEEALKRGVEEEIGITVKVVKYLGCMVSHFSRPDGTDIEKTTLYFLTEKLGESEKSQAEDELTDTIEWVEKPLSITLLKEQHNEEFEVINRVTYNKS